MVNEIVSGINESLKFSLLSNGLMMKIIYRTIYVYFRLERVLVVCSSFGDIAIFQYCDQKYCCCCVISFAISFIFDAALHFSEYWFSDIHRNGLYEGLRFIKSKIFVWLQLFVAQGCSEEKIRQGPVCVFQTLNLIFLNIVVFNFQGCNASIIFQIL